MPGQKWTKENEEYLVKRYEDLTCEQIAETLGKTTRAVQHKFNKLGLKRKQPEVGDKVNRLTIKKKYIKPHYNQNATFVIAECECGSEKEYLLKNITSGGTKSCGCYKSDIQRDLAIKRNYKHGQSQNNNYLFKTWIRLKAICNIPSSSEYKNFGAKGIKVCEAWSEFTSFEQWSLNNGYENGCGIKRYNKNQNFNPENCYWINKKHGQERLYKIWLGMFVRCYDTRFPYYCTYGGRGIKIEKIWHIYINFRNWSIENGYTEDLSIDKIDNNYHYGPNNCRWATFEQQLESKYNNRQILAFNEVKSLLHWTRDPRCKNDIETIKKHLAEGKSPEEAMSA